MIGLERISDETRIIDLTVGELKQLVFSMVPNKIEEKEEYVYGLRGIADLFGCSTRKALDLKNGKIKKAVIQDGRKIIVNRKMALDLFSKK